MKDPVRRESASRKSEWAVALVATLLSMSLHVLFTIHAGGLWRDEVNTVNVSNLPSLTDVWGHIEFDSFPILWLLIVRGWSVLGGTDFLFRLLGFGIGVSCLALLWFNARAFKGSAPLLSVALIGFSPSIIQWGDSMRGYGFGTLMMLLTAGLMWRVLDEPTGRNVGLFMLAALGAVQSLYYNAVLLFSLCMGGCAVTLSNRRWRGTGAVLAVGGVSALSLVPYFSVFERSKSWGPMFQHPDLWRGIRLDWFWTKLREALNPAGAVAVWVWVGLLVVVLGGGMLCLLTAEETRLGRGQRDLILFSSVALVVAIVGYYLFLKKLQYPTQPWYYVALLTFVALPIDVASSAFSGFRTARIARLLVAGGIVAMTVLPAMSAVRTRMTNLDVVAAWLEQNAQPGDLLVVNPWYYGITFARYYHGDVAWVTIPPVEDHRYARVDLFLSHMTTPDQREPVRPILDQVAQTLGSGKRVWLVGGLHFLQPHEQASLQPPAPNGRWGWHDGPYSKSWSMQVAGFIQSHAARVDAIPFSDASRTNGYEDILLLVVQGWRGN